MSGGNPIINNNPLSNSIIPYTSVNPLFASAGTGVVQFNGTSLLNNVKKVLVGRKEVSPLPSFSSDNSFIFNVPSELSDGKKGILVIRDNNRTQIAFLTIVPAPIITSLNTMVASPNSTVTISGENLQYTSTVRLSTSQGTIIPPITQNSITFTVPSNIPIRTDIRNGSVYNVYVINSDTTTSSQLQLIIISPPAISSLSYDLTIPSLPIFAGVSLGGTFFIQAPNDSFTNLQYVSKVFVGTLPVTINRKDQTKISVTLPSTAVVTVGTSYNVYLENPDGRTSNTLINALTIINPPLISAFFELYDPGWSYINYFYAAPGATLGIRGNLNIVSSVYMFETLDDGSLNYGGVNNTVVTVIPTNAIETNAISSRIPFIFTLPSNLIITKFYYLFVRNADGMLSNRLYITIRPPPVISLIDPSYASLGGTVKIYGTNITDVVQGQTPPLPAKRVSPVVTVGGKSVVIQNVDFQIVNNNNNNFSIQFNVPLNASVSNNISSVVLTNSDETSSNISLNIIPAPVITSLYPSSASIGGIVTITGSNFANAVRDTTTSRIFFSTTNAFSPSAINTAFTYNSNTSLSFKVPANVANNTTYNIFVRNPDGVNSTSNILFTVIPAPTITSINSVADQIIGLYTFESLYTIIKNYRTTSTDISTIGASNNANINIKGTNIINGAILRIRPSNGSPDVDIPIEDNTFNCNLSGKVTDGLTYTFQIINPDNTFSSVFSRSPSFGIIPKPTITSLNLVYATYGGIIFISGTGFVAGSKVILLSPTTNPPPVTLTSVIVVSNNSIRIVLPLFGNANGITSSLNFLRHVLYVINPDNTVSPRNTYGLNSFQFLDPPIFNGVTPTNVYSGTNINAQTGTLTINGGRLNVGRLNFSSGSSPSIIITSSQIVVISLSQITVKLYNFAAGSYTFALTNEDGSSLFNLGPVQITNTLINVTSILTKKNLFNPPTIINTSSTVYWSDTTNYSPNQSLTVNGTGLSSNTTLTFSYSGQQYIIGGQTLTPTGPPISGENRTFTASSFTTVSVTTGSVTFLFPYSLILPGYIRLPVNNIIIMTINITSINNPDGTSFIPTITTGNSLLVTWTRG